MISAIAVTPAQPQQVVEQRFGQDAEVVAIRIDPQRAVALGQLRAVRTVDQRDVSVDRIGSAALDAMHRADDDQLAKGVVEVIVAADDVVTPMS